MKQSPEGENQLEEGLDKLQASHQQLLDLGHEMMSNTDLYPMDLLTTAVLNRSLSLLDGFVVLVRGSNTLAALHLVRLHLDSLLRYSAAWLVEEPHAFAMEVFAGKPIRKMKDRTGAFMTDRYLVDKLAVEYAWVSSVYAETSGYVHLSQKHYHSAIRKKKEVAEDGRTMEAVISKGDLFIPYSLKLDSAGAMFEITGCICQYVYGWTHTKNGGTPPDQP
jgi:hypothetical protein